MQSFAVQLTTCPKHDVCMIFKNNIRAEIFLKWKFDIVHKSQNMRKGENSYSSNESRFDTSNTSNQTRKKKTEKKKIPQKNLDLELKAHQPGCIK